MKIPEIKFKTFYNTFKTTDFNNKDAKMKDDKKSLKSLFSLIQYAKDARNYEEVCKILHNAVIDEEIEELDPITYKSGDYIIQNSLKVYADDYTKLLKKLTEKEIKIAPRFVDSIDKEDNTIIITKIPGMNGKDLIPYNEEEANLPKDTKLEAYQDIQKLLKAGIVNNKMLRSVSSWYITPESKKIIIPDWSSLRLVDDEERAPILNKFHKMLFNQ